MEVAKFTVLELCHFVTLPVFPVTVKVVEFVPSQTEVDPDIVPPTDNGLTTKEIAFEVISVLQEEAAPEDFTIQ